MANDKAAGLDELSVEHVKYCHPIIVCILSKLFNLFVTTGHIPEDFGASYTVPISKYDGRVTYQLMTSEASPLVQSYPSYLKWLFKINSLYFSKHQTNNLV